MLNAESDVIVRFINCDHEVDMDAPMEPGDYEDIARFKAACMWVRCKHCGCRGLCVDDTGDFWEDPITKELC
jgi:hypothetical protein